MKIIDVLCFHVIFFTTFRTAVCTEFTSCVLLFPLLILISIAASSFHLSLRDPGSLDFNMYRLLLLAFFFFRSSFSVLQCNKYIEAINFYDFFFQTESYQEQKRGSLVCNGRLFCDFQNSSRSISQQQFTGGQFTCSKELIFSSYLYRIF